MKTILITGAAGAAGRFLRRELAGRYQLRLTDVVPIDDVGANESYLRADVVSATDMARAAAGCDGIVHLGPVSVEGAWEPILAAFSAPGDGVADRMQGGDFCVVERGGDPTGPEPD